MFKNKVNPMRLERETMVEGMLRDYCYYKTKPNFMIMERLKLGGEEKYKTQLGY